MKNKNKILLGLGFISVLALSGCGNKVPSSSADSSSRESTISSSIDSSDESSSSSLSSEEISSSEVQKDPVFSQNHYSYDKNISEDLELPLNLYGCNIYVVEFNGEQLLAKYFYYDSKTSCLVIKMDYLCTLENGTYSIRVIVDGENVSPAETSLEITNSILTEFDEVRRKEYRYGKDTAVTFNCDFATASVVSLKKDDIIIDESYYKYENNALVISADLLNHCYGVADFTIELSNHDSYDFSVKTDTLFFTDYDITTIDDKTESTAGGNPLYQYATSEKQTIVDATEFGMTGNALKYIPNYENVDLDCHGIFTLGSENSGMTWYELGYRANGKYLISFDYVTHDSKNNSEQTFCFATVNAWGAPFVYQENLLIGPENDDQVHHFSAILTGDQISHGTLIYAKWLNGSGYLLVDNMRVLEIADEPSLNESYEYRYGSTDDYTIAFDTKGWIYDLYIDGVKVEDIPMSSQGIVLSADYLNNLGVGMHVIKISTAIGDYDAQLKIIDDRKAELTQNSANYISGIDSKIELSASITEGITIDSVYQVDKNDVLDQSYQNDGWRFTKIDTTYDYSQLVSMQSGLDGNGKVILSKEFLEKVANTSTFVISFCNGKSSTFSITSNKLVVSNYDDTTIWGNLNGEDRIESPFSSGMGGSLYEIKEREEGNKAIYINDTTASADSCFFTIRTLNHPWAWYTIDGDQEHLYREQFTYQISDVTGVYLRVIVPLGLDVNQNFFGDYDEVFNAGGWNEVRYNLICDGQVHSLDTGWFTVGEDINSDFRLLQVVLPRYSQEEGRFVMFDDFSYSQTLRQNIDVSYKKGQAEDVIISNDYDIKSVFIDDINVPFENTNEKTVKLDKETLETISLGEHVLSLKTTEGAFKGKIVIKSNGIAELVETTKSFKKGDQSVSLSGNFEEVTISEAKKYGSSNLDVNKNDGVSLNTSLFSVDNNRLVVSKNILDNLYGTTTFKLTMSNGALLEFTLTSDVLFYDNFNDPNIWIYGNPGNCLICQDTNMTSFEEDENGQQHLVYEPKNAVLGHANYPGTHQNGILSFRPTESAPVAWESLNMDPNKTYILTLNYKVTGGTENAHFRFYRWFASGEVIDDKEYNISHSETVFTIEIGGSELNGFYFFCNYASADDIADLKIDIYSIQITEKANA